MRLADTIDRVRVIFGKLLGFFFVLSLLLLLLYALGSYQEFLDSSQLWLLRVIRISLGGVVFTGLYGAVLMIIGAATRRRFPGLRFVLTLLAVVMCAALLLVLTFLSSWFQGSR